MHVETHTRPEHVQARVAVERWATLTWRWLLRSCPEVLYAWKDTVCCRVTLPPVVGSAATAALQQQVTVSESDQRHHQHEGSGAGSK